MAIGIMTLGIMTLGIMTLRIITLSIGVLLGTLSINETQPNHTATMLS